MGRTVSQIMGQPQLQVSAAALSAAGPSLPFIGGPTVCSGNKALDQALTLVSEWLHTSYACHCLLLAQPLVMRAEATVENSRSWDSRADKGFVEERKGQRADSPRDQDTQGTREQGYIQNTGKRRASQGGCREVRHRMSRGFDWGGAAMGAMAGWKARWLHILQPAPAPCWGSSSLGKS